MARTALALLALVLAAAPLARAAEPSAQDETTLRQLNDDYVKAFLSSDTARFKELLADDFAGILADGRVIDKAEFLREAKVKPDASDLRLHGVTIHAYGDSAMVMAAVSYHRSSGADVRTRYTTLYVRRDASWVIAWVQWTRVSAP
ncbi:MAG TPA: nuclear transport factor 2 family protein [Opitutaceae bacterium]|jgi:ketosteroid isomerase-like protein|nr:nuclear transport factor 2 family protein [Opitutaceae bacterium]